MLPLLVALLVPAPGPQPQEIARVEVPEWVVELELPQPAGGPAPVGVEFLLQDQQDDLRGEHPQHFRRMVTRVAGPAGVDSESRLEIEFDPSAEQLALHRVVVHRGGVASDRLATLDLRVLQRERELESLLCDGRATAVGFLEDVRVGDLVEIAYSLSGRKSVLGERWFDGFPTAWGVEVRRMHRRLLVPAGRELAVRLHGGASPPRQRPQAWGHELVWDLDDVAAVPIEDGAPSWHDPLPWAQVSEHADWPGVARWGAELFAPDEAPGELVRALAAELAGQSEDPLERTRLALRRVQQDVRYLGLLLGESSHRPNAPETVLARRYGDCKDKALLLVTLLEDLDIEARVALVNTVDLHTVREQLPSPGAFDHAVVRVRVAGEELWLDPTLSAERGPIDEFALPDYGVALLLDGESGDLVEVVRDRGSLPLTRVEKRYVLGQQGDATLEVVTTYTGARANSVRAGLEAMAPEALGDLCLQYLTEQHPQVLAQETPTIEDDAQANLLRVRERYVIPDPWEHADVLTVGCVELAGEFNWPVALRRRHPFALAHPARIEQHLEVEFATVAPSPARVVRVADPAFRFESRGEVRGGRLTIDASFETLRDHVPAAEVATYADALARAQAELYRDIRPPRATPAAASSARGNDVDLAAYDMGRTLGAGLFVWLLLSAASARRRRRLQTQSSGDAGDSAAPR